MHELDQEVACVARFILGALEDVTPYYWEMKQDFNVPAVFFPTPEIDTAGDALDSYRMEFIWNVKLFHKTDGEAQNLAQTVLTAIQRAHRFIPLYNKDGSAIGRGFRVLDPSIRRVDRGAWQLSVRWRSARQYTADEAAKVMRFFMEGLGGTLYGASGE